MKFIRLYDKAEADQKTQEELSADYEEGGKIEKWKVGRLALYQKSGPFGIRYLPLPLIRRAYPHDFQIKSGCSCAGTFPSRGVVVEYDMNGEKGVLKMIPNKEKESEQILAQLKKQIPDLLTDIPDLYKKETRERY